MFINMYVVLFMEFLATRWGRLLNGHSHVPASVGQALALACPRHRTGRAVHERAHHPQGSTSTAPVTVAASPCTQATQPPPGRTGAAAARTRSQRIAAQILPTPAVLAVGRAMGSPVQKGTRAMTLGELTWA